MIKYTPRIDNIKTMSLKQKLVLGISIFGTLWLILETLSFFGVNLQLFQNLKVWGFVILIILSWLITLLIDYSKTKSRRSQIDYILLNIDLPESGEILKLQTPKDLHGQRFLELLLAYLDKSKDSNYSQVEKYDHLREFLAVKRNRRWKEINSQKTLAENKIVINDVLRIKAEIVKPSGGGGGGGIEGPFGRIIDVVDSPMDDDFLDSRF